MTIKLFNENPYIFTADATVLTCQKVKEGWAVTLDQTIFYPRGGGQPPEKGTIGGVNVADVYEQGSEIIHITTAPIEAGETSLEIDSDQRRDHMVQHLGEHILSACIQRLFGGNIGILRIEEDSSHIEIDRALTIDQLLEAQKMANEIINENRRVNIHFLSPPDAISRGIPREKAQAHEQIRVIEIEDFDFNGCAGTHCSTTKEVQKLVICGTKEVRGMFRIYFKCGKRAFLEEDERTKTLLGLQEDFGAISRQEMAEKAAAALERKNLLEERIKGLAEQLLAQSHELYLNRAEAGERGLFIFDIIEEGDAKSFKTISERICLENQATVIFAIKSGESLSLIFQRSKGQPEPNLGEALKGITSAHGGKGGGSAILAQGMMADTEAARTELTALVKSLKG